MKNIVLMILLIVGAIGSLAQGSLLTTPGTSIKTANNAFIVLDNVHVVNNGSFVQAIGNGSTKFTGNTDVTISGSNIVTFDKLYIDKTAGSKVALQQNVSAIGQLNFASGLFDLANSVLDLGTTGTVIGETETHRIFTFGNGYVQIINTLNAPVSANPGNLGAIITTTKNMGSVTIRRGHLAQPNVSGTNPGIRRYFDILPTNDNGLKATLRFQYFDAELMGLDETTLELWKQGKRNWTNVGYTTRSAINNYVEKTGISTLSRWTLSGAMLAPSMNNMYTQAIENSEIKNQLSVWPNPTLQSINVLISVKNSSLIGLKLYDAKGSLILTRQARVAVGINLINIDMSNLAAGIYNLVAEDGAGFRNIKQLIKQ